MHRARYAFLVIGVMLMVLGVALITGCAGHQPIPLEPKIVTKEVKVEVPVPCKALVQLGPDPVYPDTAEAISNAPGIGELAALYAKGRIIRMQRLAEYATAKAACIF